jgi:3-oxoacyl-[acyl-carrier-protein] synthase II
MLGEGAGFLVLETLAAARQRGVEPLALLAGWFIGAEGRERAGMDSSGEGLARVLRESLAAASLVPAEVGYLNLHGTGTRLNDLAEAQAVRIVFGDDGPPGCSSTKPITGHCMGAGAALEAIISIEALRRQLLPPSANCDQPDPECAIDLVRGQPRPAAVRAALSLSSGFWGNQGALVFRSL